MPHFDIWAEGYLATGMEGIPATAIKLATWVEGYSFDDAVRKWFNDPFYGSRRQKGYGYNPKTNSSYTRLFDNETDARRSFG